jgi:RNA polymerase subunit RPABC4/transcription elongation factor Spt4
MTENISNLIVAAAAVIGAIVAALVGGITVWTFRDIRSRSRDILVQILATVLVAVVPVAGILVYFMLRPRETLQEAYVRALEEESLLSSIEHQEFCPTCGRRVDQDMQFCPSCHTKLRNACANCGRAVHLSWDLCPYCGTEQTPEMPRVNVKRPTQPRMPAPTQPTRQVPATAPRAISVPKLDAMPSAQAAKAKLGNLLDRVGGAVGGAIDNVASRTQQRGEPTEPPQPPTKRNTPNGAYTRPQADEDELE